MVWEQALVVAAMFAANIITVITLYIHQDTKTSTFLKAIHDEMKDFHGKLERQDAEFKGRLEKQDAEFKMHLIYGHQTKKTEE